MNGNDDNSTAAAPGGLAAIQAAGIDFQLVRTEIANSAEESAQFQGIPLGSLLRTIVLRRGENDYVFVLVPGGRQIDWPKLRAHLGVKRMSLPDKEEARDVTGYERGAITPFGSANPWPVIADVTIKGAGTVAIGAGARGCNFHLDADDLIKVTSADVADVTVPEQPRQTP